MRPVFLFSGFLLSLALAGCSVNPATGDQQFTALMPPGQEERIGAAEHDKVMREFGGPFANQNLEAYVNRIGARITAHTERPDVRYRFFVLDTPMVNAFALPGGYIYVSRGLLALAGSEAEMAAVLAHEIGHVTARHSAERYSQGMLAGLGVAVLSAAVGDPGVTRAAGLGSELALKSYSRTQEYQADELGIRYLSRAGYDPFAASQFLYTLDQWTKYDAHIAGKKGRSGGGYFDTHPQTDDRVARAAGIARQYPPSDVTNADGYLRAIDGLTYGESARTGFVRDRQFIHPDLGFTFAFPDGFRIQNLADRVVGVSTSSGAAVVFDGVKSSQAPLDYLRRWAGDKPLDDVQEITVNGARGAIARTAGSVNGKTAVIRLAAIAGGGGQVYRFQIAMPDDRASIAAPLRDMIYSFRTLTDTDRAGLKPRQIDLVTAMTGDTATSLAARMKLNNSNDNPEDRFRVLNGMTANEQIKPGRVYKIVR